jgi:hypothetical protein
MGRLGEQGRRQFRQAGHVVTICNKHHDGKAPLAGPDRPRRRCRWVTRAGMHAATGSGIAYDHAGYVHGNRASRHRSARATREKLVTRPAQDGRRAAAGAAEKTGLGGTAPMLAIENRRPRSEYRTHGIDPWSGRKCLAATTIHGTAFRLLDVPPRRGGLRPDAHTGRCRTHGCRSPAGAPRRSGRRRVAVHGGMIVVSPATTGLSPRWAVRPCRLSDPERQAAEEHQITALGGASVPPVRPRERDRAERNAAAREPRVQTKGQSIFGLQQPGWKCPRRQGVERNTGSPGRRQPPASRHREEQGSRPIRNPRSCSTRWRRRSDSHAG